MAETLCTCLNTEVQCKWWILIFMLPFSSFYLLHTIHLKKCKGTETPVCPKALSSTVSALKDKGTHCKRSVSNINKKCNLHLLLISDYVFLNIVTYSREIVLTILIELCMLINATVKLSE